MSFVQGGGFPCGDTPGGRSFLTSHAPAGAGLGGGLICRTLAAPRLTLSGGPCAQTSTRPLATPANPPAALSPAPWPPVCSMVVQYASQIPSSRQTQPVLQSQVESLLRRTYGRWKSRSPSPGRGAGPSVTDIPWDDVIALCINHKLRDWMPPRLPVMPGG